MGSSGHGPCVPRRCTQPLRLYLVPCSQPAARRGAGRIPEAPYRKHAADALLLQTYMQTSSCHAKHADVRNTSPRDCNVFVHVLKLSMEVACAVRGKTHLWTFWPGLATRGGRSLRTLIQPGLACCMAMCQVTGAFYALRDIKALDVCAFCWDSTLAGEGLLDSLSFRPLEKAQSATPNPYHTVPDQYPMRHSATHLCTPSPHPLRI